MWKSLWEALNWIIKTIGGWLLDLLTWLIEFIYELVNEFISWLYVTAGEAAIAFLESIKPYIPEYLVDYIISSYQWLVYINAYLPVDLSITLFISYYAIYLIVATYRIIKSWIPFIG